MHCLIFSWASYLKKGVNRACTSKISDCNAEEKISNSGHPSSHLAQSSYRLSAGRSLETIRLYDLWSRPQRVARLLWFHSLPPCPPSLGRGQLTTSKILKGQHLRFSFTLPDYFNKLLVKELVITTIELASAL